jgi:hypothetical protein
LPAWVLEPSGRHDGRARMRAAAAEDPHEPECAALRRIAATSLAICRLL